MALNNFDDAAVRCIQDVVRQGKTQTISETETRVQGGLARQRESITVILSEDIFETCDIVESIRLECVHPAVKGLYQIWFKDENSLELQLTGGSTETLTLGSSSVEAAVSAIEAAGLQDEITVLREANCNLFIRVSADIVVSLTDGEGEVYCVNWIPTESLHRDEVSLRCSVQPNSTAVPPVIIPDTDPDDDIDDEQSIPQSPILEPILRKGETLAADWTSTCGYQVSPKGSGEGGESNQTSRICFIVDSIECVNDEDAQVLNLNVSWNWHTIKDEDPPGLDPNTGLITIPDSCVAAGLIKENLIGARGSATFGYTAGGTGVWKLDDLCYSRMGTECNPGGPVIEVIP